MEKKITNSREAYDLVASMIKDEEQENLIAILLNAGQISKSIHLITIGTENQVHIPINIIARIAVINGAKGVILAHNHPSGDATPSSADIKMTKKAENALEMLDIGLLDHIIIGNSQYFSITENKVTTIQPSTTHNQKLMGLSNQT